MSLQLSGSYLPSIFIHLEHGWEIGRKQKIPLSSQNRHHKTPKSNLMHLFIKEVLPLFGHNHNKLDLLFFQTTDNQKGAIGIVV
jgi:hypothetical protein